MARILSAALLIPVVAGALWLPPLGTLAAVELVLLAALLEYLRLAEGLGARPPRLLTGAAALAVCAAVALGGGLVDVVLMAALVAVGAAVVGAGRTGREGFQDATGAIFALAYLAIPLGALASLRTTHGPEGALLALLPVVASDVAQYYGGRWCGRRPLAPALSPKKTVEGAAFGVLAAALCLAVAGAWWLPGRPVGLLVLLGATVGVLGIVGDLFESMLKRGAGVKDASALIPGHGGVLDRIDAYLFVAPFVYVFLRLPRP